MIRDSKKNKQTKEFNPPVGTRMEDIFFFLPIIACFFYVFFLVDNLLFFYLDVSRY